MSTVSVTQINPDDEITAAGANLPHNQLAAAINGNLDDDNISSVSGTKIVHGTTPVEAFDANTNPETRTAESLSNFVASGIVWSAVSGLNGTMTSGVVYILGKRLVISSVSNRTYTASKDTYVDIGSTGTLTYSEVANGAASPALAANSVRVAKVVTSGSAITSVVTVGNDSIGNSIRPTGPVSFSKIDSSSFPKFRAYLNTAQTSSNGAIIKLDTKTYDTHSAFNTTTWRYVAPVAGTYSFSWNIQTTTGTSVLSALSVNGVETSRGTWSANSGSFIASSGSDNVQLNVGDYAQLLCSQMGGTATTTNGSSITYMSGRLMP